MILQKTLRSFIYFIRSVATSHDCSLREEPQSRSRTSSRRPDTMPPKGKQSKKGEAARAASALARKAASVSAAAKTTSHLSLPSPSAAHIKKAVHAARPKPPEVLATPAPREALAPTVRRAAPPPLVDPPFFSLLPSPTTGPHRLVRRRPHRLADGGGGAALVGVLDGGPAGDRLRRRRLPVRHPERARRVLGLDVRR